MLGRPAIAKWIDHDQALLRQALQHLVESGDSEVLEGFLEQQKGFARAVRSVLIDFLARAFVRGPELKRRFDELFAPAPFEAMRRSSGEALQSAAKSLRPRLEECGRFLESDVVPMVVGLLEDSELDEISRDYRAARDRPR